MNAKVISIDYRQPPLHDYSDVLEDTVAVWTEILKTQDAAKTAMFGSSAGGNITLATMHKLEELGLEIPGAIFVGTPSSDLSVKKDTWHTLEGLDPLGKREGLIDATFDLYAPKGNFTGPLVSPIYGDVTGFPPTILISGTRDLLLRFECIVN
ncbi:alpha/beta hydrolase fold domain-containing protein [Colwellia sp. 12G3]|uniref:alpha/beta hydrolase fold domain-containing protein n=1 Tax=Colwellia sp. 12G3 TaxID=2058299 RepID=UPI0018E299CD|nr:alpha/beta hydrolase fold domain-containing protein [Colwellia sp. 12G3]